MAAFAKKRSYQEHGEGVGKAVAELQACTVKSFAIAAECVTSQLNLLAIHRDEFEFRSGKEEIESLQPRLAMYELDHH